MHKRGTVFLYFALLALAAISLGGTAAAQTITIGTPGIGTSGSAYGPLYASTSTTVYYSYYAAIIHASEMAPATAGQITTLRWQKSNDGVANTNDLEVDIYIKHTADTSFTANADWTAELNGASLVYSSTTRNITALANQWEEFNLSSPFQWNGTDNFKVFVRAKKNSPTVTAYLYWWSENLGAGSYHTAIINTTSATIPSVTRRTYFPAIQLVVQPSTPMVVSSIDAAHPTTSPVFRGTSDQEILRVKVTTSGADFPLSLSTLKFATNGSSAPLTDFTNAKVYYTGSSSVFSTANLFGSFANPIGMYMVTGSQTLLPGDNYFWLAYDVPASATLNNVIDAECHQLTIGSSLYSPAIIAPLGNRVIRERLDGIYTIGGVTPDYPTFAAAVQDLTDLGVKGPVTFNVRPGTYLEQISLPEVYGASSANTVTFRSESGDSTSVVLNHDGTAAADNFVVKFSGGDYFRILNMTLRNNGLDYGRVVVFENNPEYNAVSGNVIIGGVTTTATDTDADLYVVYNDPTATTGNANYNTISNNTIENGSYGIYWAGYGTSAPEDGNVFTGNTVRLFGNYGMRVAYQNSPLISMNTIKDPWIASSTKYGLYVYYCYGAPVVVRNIVSLPGITTTVYGLEIYYNEGAAGNQGLVANNFVTVGGTAGAKYALYWYYNDYMRCYHNTIVVAEVSTGSAYGVYAYGDSPGNEFVNNIVDNKDDYYCIYTSYLPFTVCDYNIYNTNGTLLYYDGVAYATLAEWQAAPHGFDQNGRMGQPEYVSMSTGDLHLAGASITDPLMTGTSLAAITDDIDGQNRFAPSIGADEACFIPTGTLSMNFVNSSGDLYPTVYVNGIVNLKYSINWSPDETDVLINLRFYSIATGQLVYTRQISGHKPSASQALEGTETFTLPSTIPAGYYRVESSFRTMGSCRGMVDAEGDKKTLHVADQGGTFCIVWPGDVDNDGRVTYADKKALAKYIADANLSASWLYGPSRFRAEAQGNPMAMLAWVPQAAMPWATAQGCYMDVDGNGVVNSFDYLGQKVNWMRYHAASTPKTSAPIGGLTFDMEQNYPNPFNPSTILAYSAPEESDVTLRVYDASGKVVATLVEGVVPAGYHKAEFHASGLSSGAFLARIEMTGRVSKVAFSKTVVMQLNK